MAERKILDQTYRCEAMPAKQAIELLGDISRLASQGAGRLPAILLGMEEEAAGDGAGGQMADLATLVAVGDILQANSSSDLRELIERIVTKAQVRRPAGYAEIDFDEEFTGRLEAIVPVAKLVLDVNYRDFFAASGGVGALNRLRAAFQTAT